MDPLVGTTVTIIFFTLLYWFNRNNKNKKTKTAPEAAGSCPVLGHLHLLRGRKPAHRIFATLADQYGPIFTIKLGTYRVMIISSSEIARECFTTKDRILANRPTSLASEILGYNEAMFGFSPYGSYWRQVRKIATVELLSGPRLEKLRHVRESEVAAFVKEMFGLWKRKNNDVVEMKKLFESVTLNLSSRMIFGKRFSDGDGAGALREFFELAGVFVVADAIPWLRWLDIGGHERAMKKTAEELDHLVGGLLLEHKEKRKVSGGINRDDDADFMDVMLSAFEDGEGLLGYDPDTVIKTTCLGLILGASDTTNVTLTWALSLLLKNPNTLKKAQHELDVEVGRERQVKESDMKNLVYLQAIIKETLRLYPAAPLLIPHMPMEDCTIGGYHVPKGIKIFVNAWKIHQDPRVWSDPCEFRPERFLSTQKDFDVKGQNFELIPFGSGRRICPGLSFALQVLELTLASLLHGFEVTVQNGEVDMSESLGMTNLKSTPLEVLLTPRLRVDLY